MNKNVIFFVISDNYSFAAANVIMGLKSYSAELLRVCDVLIYHDGISEQNMRLLRELHPNTYFEEMIFPDLWKPILEHENTKKWGHFIVAKFFGLRLIEKYDYALLLDADMLVRGDLSELFTLDVDLAWREVIAWDPRKVFAPILTDKDITVGNGGMILFTSRLRRFGIDDAAIYDAFNHIKDLSVGGIDELTLAWLAYTNKADVKVLDMDVYNTSACKPLGNSRIIHFLSWRKTSTKPWVNLAAYLYFDDWAENYQKWLAMGGDGPVKYTKADYYDLFAFDKAGKIAELQKESKKKDKKIAELQNKLDKIYNSRSWKAVQFARRVRDKLRKVLQCFKK